MDDSLIASLRAAVEARPDDLPLRLHLAGLLLDREETDEAMRHAARALQQDPASEEARALMQRALDPVPPPPDTSLDDSAAATTSRQQPTPQPEASEDDTVDWHRLEDDLSSTVPPMFVDRQGDEGGHNSPFSVGGTGVTLADVGGMEDVKKRLHAAFIAPLRRPELRRLYGKSLRGGLLLYGPPGCGKTFLARAVAGELDAAFLTVSLADVLDMFIGNSEKNVRELFETARAAAPCVLFLDEIDALGQKRSLASGSGIRTTVNQLLSELDGIGASNDGVFVLAATNHPWDVDPALRRPGRLDRTLLVLPPDEPAREAIFRYHLRDRPVEWIDLRTLARRTDGWSGADIAHVCDSATEVALLDSVELDEPRLITMDDLAQALGETRPSIRPWLETARNVALYANSNGEYDELATYLRRQGIK